jgi:hypothetical protein
MNESHAPSSADAVRKEYSERQQTFEAVATSSSRRSAWAIAACAACIVLAALPFLLRIGVHTPYVAGSLILALAAVWQIRILLRHRHRAVDAAYRAAFYERGIDRMDVGWIGKGNAGADFARDHHPYQNDLDVLGKGSLFELLATTRSDAGAERLAAFLLDPVTAMEAIARQEAVKELRSAVALREEIDILGKYRFQDCSRRRLQGWLYEPVLRVPRAVSVLLALLTVISLALAAIGIVQLYPWAEIAPMLVFSLAGQGAIAFVFMRRVRARLEVLRTLSSDVSVLRAGIELVERLKFQCAKLSAITENLSAQDAGKTVRTLERLLTVIDHREDAVLYFMFFWFVAGTQLVLAVERWRSRHQANFERWLSAWAEFEALSALAGYAYEHPTDVFPDLIDGGAHFEGKEMGHPLLSEPTCVTNDIALDAKTRFYIVSGSNMAGKALCCAPSDRTLFWPPPVLLSVQGRRASR